MPIELICELASAHGGKIDLAKRMIDAAAAAGADTVKTQAYLPQSVNPKDPQAAWLVQSALSEDHHRVLCRHAEEQRVRYFASAFDAPSYDFVCELCGRVKIASTESDADWWHNESVTHYVSRRWFVPMDADPPLVQFGPRYLNLVTVPMYPTPLDALARVDFARADGYSDHCAGLSAAMFAATKVDIIEVHVTIPGARERPWDKSPWDIKRLKDWMGECQVMRSGVSRQFRERWVR